LLEQFDEILRVAEPASAVAAPIGLLTSERRSIWSAARRVCATLASTPILKC